MAHNFRHVFAFQDVCVIVFGHSWHLVHNDLLSRPSTTNRVFGFQLGLSSLKGHIVSSVHCYYKLTELFYEV